MEKFKRFFKKLKDRIKQDLLSGILVIVPLVATIWVIWLIIKTMDSFLNILPHRLRPDTIVGFHIPGLGIIFTFLLILIAGMVARNIAGKRAITLGENLLARIPFIKNIYSAVKKFVQTIFNTTSGVKLGNPVLVEFPRKGIYSIGFVTGKAIPDIYGEVMEGKVTVFIPTTPNITTGFFILASEEEVTPVHLSGQDIFQIILSAGIAIPDREKDGNEKAKNV